MTPPEPAAVEGVDVGAETLAYLGLDPARPEARALVLLCRRYGLDPLLGHVRIIAVKGGGNQIYVSRDGMLEIAHRSGVLDGIVVEEERESEHGWSATIAVYRRDMSHPFRYRGGCGRSEPQAEQGNGAEMALARAERRALKRAFAIPAIDDIDDPIIEPAEVEHRTVGQTNGWLICSCGHREATVWAMSLHRKTPGLPAPVPPGPGPSPAATSTVAPTRRRGGRADQNPPPEYYDNLPEAKPPA